MKASNLLEPTRGPRRIRTNRISCQCMPPASLLSPNDHRLLSDRS